MNRLEETWHELGFHIRPTSYWVFVRTDPVQKQKNGIWLPDKVSSFWHGGLGHQRIITAYVIAAGPDVHENHGFQVGDHIAFKRLHFASYRQMDDQTYVGYLNANEVVGFPELEEQDQVQAQALVPEVEEQAPFDPDYAITT